MGQRVHTLGYTKTKFSGSGVQHGGCAAVDSACYTIVHYTSVIVVYGPLVYTTELRQWTCSILATHNTRGTMGSDEWVNCLDLGNHSTVRKHIKSSHCAL